MNNILNKERSSVVHSCIFFKQSPVHEEPRDVMSDATDYILLCALGGFGSIMLCTCQKHKEISGL